MPHTILGLPTINARTGGGAEVSRDRWDAVPAIHVVRDGRSRADDRESDGILITYVRGDRALVTG